MKRNFPSLFARFLLCLAVSLFALLLALQVTLFNESYLLQTLERTNYYTNVAHTAKTVCESFFSQAQFGVGMVGNYISEDTVVNDIQSAIYNRFRNAGIKTTARFGTLTSDLADTVYSETGTQATESDLTRYFALQSTCEGSYQTMVSVPFDAALSIVLQYRSLCAVLYAALGVIAFFSLLSLFKLSADMPEFLKHLSAALVPAGFACTLGGLSFVLFSGFQNWMPSDNIAHASFTRWFGGLFPYLAVFGIVIGVCGLILGVLDGKKLHQSKPALSQQEPKAGASDISRLSQVPAAPAHTSSPMPQPGTPAPVSGHTVSAEAARPAVTAQTQPQPVSSKAVSSDMTHPVQQPMVQPVQQPTAQPSKSAFDTMTISFPAQQIANAAPTKREIRLPSKK